MGNDIFELFRSHQNPSGVHSKSVSVANQVKSDINKNSGRFRLVFPSKNLHPVIIHGPVIVTQFRFCGFLPSEFSQIM